MSIQTQIDRISGAVSEQETLLDQALLAIQNKAAGSGSGGSGTVNLQDIYVTPKAEFQTFEPEAGYDGFSKVYVAPEPDLKAENIKKGVVLYEGQTGYEIVGTYEGSGGGSNAYSKSEELTWSSPTEIRAETGIVYIPHSLGVIPDGFVISAVNSENGETEPIVNTMLFDRTVKFGGSDVSPLWGFGMGGDKFAVSACFDIADSFCTLENISFEIADVDGTQSIPAGKQYRVLVYKR